MNAELLGRRTILDILDNLDGKKSRHEEVPKGDPNLHFNAIEILRHPRHKLRVSI